MRSLLITTFLILTFNFSEAQNLTSEQADKQTYDAFFSNDYKTTIQLGNHALSQGIDFYLLRYRLGVSYYELKNYEEAIPHFEKAKDLQDLDPVLLEYLYFSYVFTNRNESAGLLAETFTDELKGKVNYKSSLFKSIAIETGALLTNNLENFKNKNLKGNNPTAQGTFYSDVFFTNLTLANQFSPKFKLQNSLSYVSNTSNEILQANTISNFENKSNYFQWNVVGSYYTNNWKLSAGFGVYNSSTITYNLPPPFNPNGRISSSKTNNVNFSGTLALSKRFKYFEPNLSFSYSNLQNYSNLTGEASLVYYPFGNINFYGNSKAGYTSNTVENNAIFTQLIGVKLFKKIWIEGFAATGNHQNYISENGLSVFNTPNKINWYAGSNLNFFLKNFDISLGYGFQERESSYTTGGTITNPNTTKYNYNYNLLKTKIVWKF